MQAKLHFAHANGIPPQCYGKLLKVLAHDYHLLSTPIIGTNVAYPVTDQWPHLCQQLYDSVISQSEGQKVILLGHSLGAVLSLMLAVQHPHLVQQVIMLDPPLLLGWKSFLLDVSKKFPSRLIDRITPAGISAKRRDYWDERQQAALRLRSRGFFKNFDEECFQAYIDYGLSPDNQRGGFRLTIPKQVEVDIFRTTPSRWWLSTPTLQVPVHNLVGVESIFYQKQSPQQLERRWGVAYSVCSGGHMFPLEHPLVVAEQIKALIIQNSSN